MYHAKKYIKYLTPSTHFCLNIKTFNLCNKVNIIIIYYIIPLIPPSVPPGEMRGLPCLEIHRLLHSLTSLIESCPFI